VTIIPAHVALRDMKRRSRKTHQLESEPTDDLSAEQLPPDEPGRIRPRPASGSFLSPNRSNVHITAACQLSSRGLVASARGTPHARRRAPQERTRVAQDTRTGPLSPPPFTVGRTESSTWSLDRYPPPIAGQRLPQFGDMRLGLRVSPRFPPTICLHSMLRHDHPSMFRLPRSCSTRGP
jgi:hypothetical protein